MNWKSPPGFITLISVFKYPCDLSRARRERNNALKFYSMLISFDLKWRVYQLALLALLRPVKTCLVADALAPCTIRSSEGRLLNFSANVPLPFAKCSQDSLLFETLEAFEHGINDGWTWDGFVIPWRLPWIRKFHTLVLRSNIASRMNE